MTNSQMPPWTADRAAAVRLMVEVELARAMDGNDPIQRKLRGEDIDLGHPHLNAVIERTSRRLHGIPDLIVPQVAEARSENSIRVILDDAIRAAMTELDTTLGFT
ncbi:hypothetical protein [Methylobacterium sp. WL19]|uniref:hypothetical protein n=1 Tax=Methylobacterium sp. WL19 TaxID=2603896 RepID=UPI0011C8B590|nr:hypothetical protein [Methylobacterium sp. WL19]TXN27135.1 hypothetical protein FV220_12495 [Methylobacterium sp. WL19]